jgi:hypothetical protein
MISHHHYYFRIMEVKRLKLVGTWDYNLKNDLCPVCKQNLTLPFITSNCSKWGNIIIGKCGHSVHENCHLGQKNGQISCRICKSPWEIKKIEKTSAIVEK